MDIEPTHRDASLILPLAATAAGGLLAVLSAVSGAEPGPNGAVRLQDALWLLAAIVLSAYLVFLTPRLSRSIAGALTRKALPASQAVAVIPACVVLGYVALIQALLHRPVLLVLGTRLPSSQVDAVFGGTVLALILVLLGWVYVGARPVVVDLVKQLIDAVVPTVELKPPAAEHPTYYLPSESTPSEAPAPSNIQDPLIGHRFRQNEYQIKNVRGVGGQATVYEAESASLGRDVAVKVLKPGLAVDARRQEQLRDEARKQAQLHHPNLVEAYYFDKEDEYVYIAMRLVGGGSLRDRLERDGPLNLVEAARLTAQVAAALQHAHEAGLVHLDVKPGNILLGSAEWPLLGDLGIAQAIGRGAGAPNQRRIEGTPGYMSPEQSRGETVDGSSDQYSLAVTCYELATGRLPDPVILAEALRGERALSPSLPASVEKVLLRALEPDPKRRFHSIRDFAIALVQQAERTRGLTQEVKGKIADASPNLLASLLLILLSPVFLAMLPSGASIRPGLPLAWPFQLTLAGAVILLLLSVRLQLIGLVQSGIESLSVVLDWRGRRYAASRGQDVRGQPSAWQSAVAACIGGLVNLAYVFGTYRLVAIPFVTIASAVVDASIARVIAVVLAGVAALFAFVVVLAIYRSGGLLPTTLILAAGWAMIGLLPASDLGLDMPGLAWIARVGVGAGILGVLLARRRQTAERAAWLGAAILGRISADEEPASTDA